MVLLKFLFILSLAFFTLGETVRFEAGREIYLKPLDITVAILFLSWIAVLLRKGFSSVNIRFFFLFFCLVSLLANAYWLGENIISSALYLFRWTAYISIYFVVLDFDRSFRKKIPFFLILSGGVFLFFSYVQYFFYQSLGNLLYLEWDNHMYRMFSTMLDPNFAGAFFVMYF